MRARMLTAVFEVTRSPWSRLKTDREPWNLTAAELRAYPEGSLGCAMGTWLTERGFELHSRLEAHDVMHVLTGIGTDAASEVELQCVLLGNGKRSAYLAATVAVGCAVYPEHLGRFRRAFLRGRASPRFFDLDARSALGEPAPAGYTAQPPSSSSITSVSSTARTGEASQPARGSGSATSV